jgi:hypothetical protein
METRLASIHHPQKAYSARRMLRIRQRKELIKLCDDYAIERALDVAEPANEDERTAVLIASGEETFALDGPEA